MELSEKLQKLRHREGLTQEELAGALYVSRTAISKWESGRGYPSVDSLRAIAEYFSVTLDELLSTDGLLSAAGTEEIAEAAGVAGAVGVTGAAETEEAAGAVGAAKAAGPAEKDAASNGERSRHVALGFVDCAMVLLAVVPIFGQRQGDFVQSVSLFSLFSASPYMAAIYAVLVVATVLLGALTLFADAFHSGLLKVCRIASLVLGCACVLVFVASRQPYAAAMAFAFLVAMAFLLFKRL